MDSGNAGLLLWQAVVDRINTNTKISTKNFLIVLIAGRIPASPLTDMTENVANPNAHGNAPYTCHVVRYGSRRIHFSEYYIYYMKVNLARQLIGCSS